MGMKSMRSRLMSYTRGMPGGPRLRERLARVASVTELEDIAAFHLSALSGQDSLRDPFPAFHQ